MRKSINFKHLKSIPLDSNSDEALEIFDFEEVGEIRGRKYQKIGQVQSQIYGKEMYEVFQIYIDKIDSLNIEKNDRLKDGIEQFEILSKVEYTFHSVLEVKKI